MFRIKALVPVILLSMSLNSITHAARQHPLADFVSEVYTMKLASETAVASGESVKIPLESVNINPGHVLVYLTGSAVLNGSDLDAVEVNIIEPCSGNCFYQHQVFPSSDAVVKGNSLILTQSELMGDNPGDDAIAGQWYVEIKNMSSSSVVLKNLELKINARLD